MLCLCFIPFCSGRCCLLSDGSVCAAQAQGCASPHPPLRAASVSVSHCARSCNVVIWNPFVAKSVAMVGVDAIPLSHPQPPLPPARPLVRAHRGGCNATACVSPLPKIILTTPLMLISIVFSGWCYLCVDPMGATRPTLATRSTSRWCVWSLEGFCSLVFWLLARRLSSTRTSKSHRLRGCSRMRCCRGPV